MDKIVEWWRPMDPGVRGDALGGVGDFENWTGAEGGCTDCPAGWTCGCLTGDIKRETAHVFKSNTSVGIYTESIAFDHDFLTVQTFAADTCYQISWCHAGDTGGVEDIIFTILDSGKTDYYNFDTDAWQGDAVYSLYGNITEAWTCVRLFVSTGATAKTDYQARFNFAGASQIIYVDDFKIEPLNSCTVVGQLGNELSVPVDSDPLWGYSEVLLPRTGTGPAYKSGMEIDEDYLLRAHDGTFDPAENSGHFSAGCKFVSTDITSQLFVLTKYTGINRDWMFTTQDGNDLRFFWWDTTGTLDVITFSNVLVQNALTSFVGTYKFLGDGSSNVYLYMNNAAVGSDLVGQGPIRDSSLALVVGAESNGANPGYGDYLECAYWDKPLTDVESNKWNNPYFPGTSHGDGFYVSTCTQAASHSTCSTQKCRSGTPVACQAEGTGTMATYGQYTETIVDNSGESPSGGDDAPDWPDWTETEVAGDGTSAISAYRADTKHGDLAFRLKTTGTTSNAQIDQCVACSGSTAYFAYADFKEMRKNVSSVDFAVQEYSGASCTTLVTTNYIFQDKDIPEAIWNYYGGGFTTDASTVGCRLVVLSVGAADILVDSFSLKAALYHTPWVENPTGAGTTTYNARDYRFDNPLARWSDIDAEYGWENGFCAAIWAYTDWWEPGATTYFLYAVGTAGNNNLWFIRDAPDNVLRFRVYNSLGVSVQSVLAVTNTEFTAGDWKYIEVCHDNASTAIGHHYNRANDTWYDWSVAGASVQDGAGSEILVGYSGAIDGHNSEIHLSPYPSGAFVWPNKGFSSGQPPCNCNQNGRPY